MSYEIQKGIPVPATKRTARAIWDKLFSEMEAGDSFQANEKDRSKIGCAVSSFKKRNKGSNFTIRHVGGNQIRVWRVA